MCTLCALRSLDHQKTGNIKYIKWHLNESTSSKEMAFFIRQKVFHLTDKVT